MVRLHLCPRHVVLASNNQAEPPLPVKVVVLIEHAVVALPDAVTTAAAAIPIKGVKTVRWNAVRASGKATQKTHTGYGFPTDVANLDLDDDPHAPYTLTYSSGTSGGAIKATVSTKHGWVGSNCSAGVLSFETNFEARVSVSYLSLSHGADRGICWQTTFAGGVIGMCRPEDDMESCLSDMQEIKPVTMHTGPAT